VKHTRAFPISCKGFLRGWRSLFKSVDWDMITSFPVSDELDTCNFWATSDCWESSALIETFLLVHFNAAHPQHVPQLPPAARHSHFVVLQRDFLLHEQQTPDADFPMTAVFPPEPSDSYVSVPNSSILLPTEKEDWTTPTWSKNATSALDPNFLAFLHRLICFSLRKILTNQSFLCTIQAQKIK